MTVLDTIVVGAGQAGLAAGYYLQRSRMRFTILEAGPQPAGSWPHYYASLQLFSTAGNSSLPGLAFPTDPDSYPARQAVIEYLASYAAHFDLPVTTNARVSLVTCTNDGFTVHTTDGRVYHARSLIAATGSFHRPYTPQLPGQTTFRGQILHSAAYCMPDPFRGQRVVVVGAGNSAVQIAAELAQTAHVTLATRRPIRFMPQRVWGHDLLSAFGLIGIERLPLGVWRRLQEPHLVIDSAGYRQAIQCGQPERRRMFTAFTPDGVVWPDGRAEPIDTTIFATGYRPNLEYLAHLNTLDRSGEPQQRAGISTATPGLYYVGLTGQRTFASATLRGVGPDAAYVVAHLRRYLRQHHAVAEASR